MVIKMIGILEKKTILVCLLLALNFLRHAM